MAAELDEEEVEEVEEVEARDRAEQGASRPLFNSLPEPTSKEGHFLASEKDVNKFDKITADAQGQCIKAVVRLFIMKGKRILQYFRLRFDA
jgi:hypothetical protein